MWGCALLFDSLCLSGATERGSKGTRWRRGTKHSAAERQKGGRKQFVIPGRLTFKCRNSLCSFIHSVQCVLSRCRLTAKDKKGALWQIGRTLNQYPVSQFGVMRQIHASSSSWPGVIDKQTRAGACCRCGQGGKVAGKFTSKRGAKWTRHLGGDESSRNYFACQPTSNHLISLSSSLFGPFFALWLILDRPQEFR